MERVFSRTAILSALLALLLAATSAYATVNWSKGYAPMRWPDIRIGSMLDGTARKPFVSRTLVPSVFKVITPYAEPHIAPLHQALMSFDETRPIVQGFDRSNRIGSESAAVVYLTMVWFSLLLLGLGIVAFLRTLGYKSLAPWALAIVAVALWPLLKCEERNMYFMYDPFTPTLVIWTLYAFFSRYFFAAGVGFVACTLNRETAVLLPGVAAFALLPGQDAREKLRHLWKSPWGGGNPKRSLWVLLGATAGIAFVLANRFVVNQIYAAAMGDAIEFHLVNTTFDLSYIFRYLPKVLLVYALYYLLGVRQWQRLNGLFQGATLMFGIQLVLGAVAGVIDEVRQYSEFYGVGAVLAGIALLQANEPMPQFKEQPAVRRRTAINALALAALVLVVTATNRHWRDSLFSQSKLARVDLRLNPELSNRKKDGQAWDAPGNYVFRSHLPAVFVVDGPREVRYLDIGLDGNDEYRVALRTDITTKEHTLQPLAKNGIHNHRLSAPPGLLSEIRVFPITGDGNYAVGHVVLKR